MVGLCSVPGCAESSVIAGASRVASPTAGDRLARPLCFAGAPPALGLAARAQFEESVKACVEGAQSEKVRVVDPGDPTCLLTTFAIRSEYTGQVETRCTGGAVDAECDSRRVVKKLLQMRIADPSTKEVLVEAEAVVPSTQKEVTPRSVFLLCRAALRHHPKPEHDVHFDVDFDGH